MTVLVDVLHDLVQVIHTEIIDKLEISKLVDSVFKKEKEKEKERNQRTANARRLYAEREVSHLVCFGSLAKINSLATRKQVQLIKEFKYFTAWLMN